MNNFKSVLKLEQLEAQTPRRVRIEGKNLVLIRIEEEVFALEDRCSHEDFPLSDGWVEEHRLSCAFHGATFDVRTGEPLSLPAYERVKTFPVRVQGGMIEVNLEC